MKRILIILALLALWPGYVHAQIVTDGVTRDPSGGGGLTESDINTPAKLNAFVTPDLADISSSQTFTNKTIDAAANTIKILKDTDCTTFDAAVDGQYCWDTDDDLLYVCETADVCDTAGEWDAVATGGSGDIEAVGSCTSGSCAIEGGNDMFPLVYEGTADDFETTFAVTDPTTPDKTITFPDLTGTVALSANKLDFFAATTSAELKGVISDETGSGGALVFATSPTLTTPTLGVASATSINKVAITAPATGSTLTIADGKTATFNNTMSFSSAGDSGVLTVPNATATLVGRDTTDTLTNKTISGASNTVTNIDDDQVLFDDANGDFSATTIGAAIEELVSSNGSGPNAADGKVNYTQLVDVPEFAVPSGTNPTVDGAGDAILARTLQASRDAGLTIR